MILFLVYDQKKQKLSLPMISESEKIAKDSLHELNPENYDDLVVINVCEIQTSTDLLRLSVDPLKSIPKFLE